MTLVILIACIVQEKFSLDYVHELDPSRQEWLSKDRNEHIVQVFEDIQKRLQTGTLNKGRIEDAMFTVHLDGGVSISGADRPDLVPLGTVLNWLAAEINRSGYIDEVLVPFGLEKSTCSLLATALESSHSWDEKVRKPHLVWLENKKAQVRLAESDHVAKSIVSEIDLYSSSVRLRLEHDWATGVLNLLEPTERRKVLLFISERLVPSINCGANTVQLDDLVQLIRDEEVPVHEEVSQ